MGGCVYFACGRRIYALDLIEGRLRWEHAPEVDSAAIRAVNAAVDTPRPRARITREQMSPSELPRAPWVTAPVLHAHEVMVGTPDGVRAMDVGDGKPTWRLGRHEVGAVDAPPAVRDGIAYVTGRRCFDPGVPRARQRVVYAVRLDGPAAAAVLTAPPWPQRHWPALVAAALAGLTVTAAWAAAEKKDKRAVAGAGDGAVGGAGSGCEGPGVIGGEATSSPHRKRLRCPDALPVLCVLAAAAFVVGWVARHPVPLPAPILPGSITAPSSTYRGPAPVAMLGAVLGLTAAAVLLGAWRRQKLATAAVSSLAITAAVAALWGRGRKAEESVTFFTWQLRADRALRRTFRLVSGRGGFRLATTRKDYTEAMGVLNARDPQRFVWSREPGPAYYPAVGPIRPPEEQGTVRRWHGFEARRGVTTDPVSGDLSLTSTSFTAPAWFLLAVTALLPSAWLTRAGWRWRKRRRVKPGRCLACGYDLTGNISGVCPECGAELLTKRAVGHRRE